MYKLTHQFWQERSAAFEFAQTGEYRCLILSFMRSWSIGKKSRSTESIAPPRTSLSPISGNQRLVTVGTVGIHAKNAEK